MGVVHATDCRLMHCLVCFGGFREKVLDAGVRTMVCCVVMVVKLWHNQLGTRFLCVVIGCEYA